VRGAGATGLSVDLAVLSAADHDALAEALEAGSTVALGVVPTLAPAGDYTDKQAAQAVERWLDMLGLDPEAVGDRLVVTPACGLAGATPGWALRALRVGVSAARQLSDG
jgi:methionine synthase II (cobalamin-independent)